MSFLKSIFGQNGLLPVWRRSFLLCLVFTGSVSLARAERFLTIEEARKICFPQAGSFEAQTVRFSPEQIAAIEKQSKVKVLNKGNRLWVARQGTNILGVLFLDYVLGKHEIIDYVVALGAEGEVARIEILEYRESHGGEVRGARWRDQFKGKTRAAPLRLNEDIYNVSGATLSCRHVTEGIQRLLATYEQVVRPRLAAAGRLPDASLPAKP